MNPRHRITYFPKPPAVESIPAIMPSPFSNTPHHLAKQASLILQQRLSTEKIKPRGDGSSALGKMFGVLVVRDQAGEIGFLSAFSGMMNGLWLHPGFVPPVFDADQHDRFLPTGQAALQQLGEQLRQLESSSNIPERQQQILALQQQRDLELGKLKQRHKAAKQARQAQRITLQTQRQTDTAPYQRKMAALALASQQHKREAINAAAQWAEHIDVHQQQLDHVEQQISQIKTQRTTQSRQLHAQVFSTYKLKSFSGEQHKLKHFFQVLPPAGTGDCAAPKLIHYAQQQQLQPLAIAEFWWGASPATGVRHHGHFYAACRGKCRPILPFMLSGLALEPEPCYGTNVPIHEPDTIYEDDVLLVINKPAGLMSAPGKEVHDSVQTRLQQRYPEHPDIKLVHRLDMGTSGLLLVAKNLPTHKKLQQQFMRHQVEKRYEALLAKQIPLNMLEGDIDLPLRVDLDDRPRQQVCFESGKSAKTHWQLIRHEGANTRIYFFPHTGRTHQLRVHAAHRDGLHASIVGDGLYGQEAERLMLHAQRLCFHHPISRKRLEFEAATPF